MTKWIQRKPRIKPSKTDDILDQIGKIRGIKDVDTFLNPSSDELHDPYLMKNIQEASNRIIKAIKANENILLSFDPDADGITATATMYRYLKNYTENVDYIYGERNDGHGITEMVKIPKPSEDDEKDYSALIERNTENVEKIKACDLLILIDSSSNDVETCRRIVENLGKEIIILDHHAIEQINPHVIMVNPQQNDCSYPNKQLSGAGVVFKTLQVMEDTLGEVDPWQYIDLVAVGMYADVMKIDVLENRYLILQGLRNMKNTGLVRILKGGKVDTYRLKADAIGFTIAPLLNGVARMDNIKLAIDILLEDDDKICKKLRLQMKKINDERKIKQKAIVEQYLKSVDASKKVLIVMDEQSSKGFNGIVAQNLTDKYNRPVIVGRIHKGTLSGSFRSYNGFKMKSFLQGFGDDIEALGHEGAGGISIPEERLDDLKTYIERFMPSLEESEPYIYYDLEFDVKDINEYVNDIERFNLLSGSGFPKVIVKVNGIDVKEVKCIGETQETVKISTLNGMELIKFRVNDQYASDLGVYDEISAIGQLSMNVFYNFKTKVTTKTPQVMIEDYKIIEE